MFVVIIIVINVLVLFDTILGCLAWHLICKQSCFVSFCRFSEPDLCWSLSVGADYLRTRPIVW